MSLSSLGYFALLPITAVVFYLVPHKLQNWVLAISSLIFLSFSLPSGTQWFVPLAALLFVTAITFFLAKAMPSSHSKKSLLWLGVGSCLVLLAVFKYYNATLPVLFGPDIFVQGALKLVFPLGISFYSFAAISYLVDVYRGDLQPETSFLRYFVFTGFFATISSGPICRGGQLLPQLRQPHTFDAQRTGQALRLFALGLFKKVAISDVLALYVNQVFEQYSQRGAISLIVGAIGYSFVLYFDFCGYSEMARASGLLLGIQLPENFKTCFLEPLAYFSFLLAARLCIYALSVGTLDKSPSHHWKAGAKPSYDFQRGNGVFSFGVLAWQHPSLCNLGNFASGLPCGRRTSPPLCG